jgi:DNA-binding XRE family transcriptional regulator
MVRPGRGPRGGGGAGHAVQQELGLSQRPFAPRIGGTRSTVIVCETGRNRPRADTFDRIAKRGGVSVDSSLHDDNGPRRHGSLATQYPPLLRVRFGGPFGKRSDVAAI